MESITQDYCQGLIADGEDGSHWVIVDDRGLNLVILKKKLNIEIEFLKYKICFNNTKFVTKNPEYVES